MVDIQRALELQTVHIMVEPNDSSIEPVEAHSVLAENLIKKKHLAKKYINAYDNAKRKFLANNPNNKDLVFKTYAKKEEYLEVLKKDDDKPTEITMYKMLKSNGDIDIFTRNRNLYLSALNNKRIKELNKEKLEYYKLTRDDVNNKYIRMPGFQKYHPPLDSASALASADALETINVKSEPIKQQICRNRNILDANVCIPDKEITMYQMSKLSNKINYTNRQRAVYMSLINSKKIKTANPAKLKEYHIIFDITTQKYIRDPEYEEERKSNKILV